MVVLYALTAALTLLTVNLVIVAGAKAGLLDLPNSRSSHDRPVPRGAGVAFVLVAIFLAIYLGSDGLLSPKGAWSVCLAAVLVGGVGFYDDKVGAGVLARIAFHAASAVIVVFLYFPLGSDRIWQDALGGAFLLLSYVWGVNLFNFMDGIDGIAILEALYICVAASFLLWNAGSEWVAFLLPFSLSLAIVLAVNWSPAKVFIGDVGSGFLGALLMTIAISTVVAADIKFTTWLILWGAFWVDATVTLLTRMATRQSWHKPHRSHVYQKIARRWSSHARATVVYLLVNVVWLFPWALACEFEKVNVVVCGVCALSPLVLVAICIGAGRPSIERPVQ